MLSLKRFLCSASVAAVTGALLMTPVSAFAATSSTDQTTVQEHGTVVNLVVPGRHVQYPSEGGTWEYGFWNAMFRSYYTVGRCHGSTVTANGRTMKSVNTAAGRRSIAEIHGLNGPMTSARYYYRVC